MLSTRAHLFAAVLLCGLSASAVAQPGDDTLRVPAGALRVLDVPVDANRPFALLRAIRVLHSVPRPDPVPRSIANFERLTDALDRLERETARANSRGITIGMASSGTGRDALRATLAALGLRLREQQRVYSAEAPPGKPETELRALLLQAGIDSAGIQKRLNDGETVIISPALVDVPLPVPAERWAADVFARTVPQGALFAAIIRSREASLLYYGLQAMTRDTRAYLSKTPGLLQWLHGRAPVVAGFGGAFRVGPGQRVMLPGGAEAEELWEGLAGQKVTQPDRFVRELFGRDAGRLAYFTDALWALDDAHLQFALGLSTTDRRTRLERFRALYSVFAQTDTFWSIADAPFTRPSYDAALLLSVINVNAEGMVAAPSHRTLWERGLTAVELPDAGDRQLRQLADDGVADAAFLTGLLAGKHRQDRRMIIERVAFGQRAFGGATDAELSDVLVALRSHGRFPAAMSALERIGIRKPALFVQTARHAAALETLGSSDAVPALAQFQGSLALLDRLARTGALQAPILEQLVTSLVAIPFEDGRYRGGIARWLRTQLMPALPAGSEGGTLEGRLLEALVDRVASGAVTFAWEGEDFVLDTERPRSELLARRERQKGNSLDRVLALYAHVAALTATDQTLEGVKSRSAAMRADAADLVPARPWPDAPDAFPDVGRVVDRAVRDLGDLRNQDVGRIERIVRPLIDALDYLLGETLVALVYIGSQGETERGFAASVDVSHRHFFGVVTLVGDTRQSSPWRRPTRGSRLAAGDAVTGSVLGLDLAMSRTRLRRLSATGLPESPRLNPNDRETMADTVALLNPRELDDAQLTQIAGAVHRGRMRVEEAAGRVEALDALAGEARLTASRRGLLDWMVRHEPTAVPDLFSLVELFRLGGGQRSTVHAWGTSHESLTGCFCLRFPDDAAWELTIGRADTGQLGAGVSELNLRVATLLADLRVPAALFPGVMALATQDYIDSVPLVHQDDWVAIAGRASALSRERVEDYVSAVVASGPVRAVESAGAR